MLWELNTVGQRKKTEANSVQVEQQSNVRTHIYTHTYTVYKTNEYP